MISRISTSLKLLLVGLLLAGCQAAPKTDLEKIAALKKQVQADAQTLDRLETNELATLERDFISCDSMLQYMNPEAVDDAFQELQLTKAYIEQFKVTKPGIKADIDSTLYRLDCLGNDVASHFLTDSLTAVYLDDEARHAALLGNQVGYFEDRFGTCQAKLNDLKGKKQANE